MTHLICRGTDKAPKHRIPLTLGVEDWVYCPIHGNVLQRATANVDIRDIRDYRERHEDYKFVSVNQCILDILIERNLV